MRLLRRSDAKCKKILVLSGLSLRDGSRAHLSIYTDEKKSVRGFPHPYFSDKSSDC